MTIAAKAESWTGRVEDDALLRGQGRFGDDVKPDGALAACFVRSPHGFARIERIETAEAKKMKGVVAVYTAADLAEAHYHSVSHGHDIPGRGGKMPFSPHRPALAGERVLHVGEPVAMVVAHSAAAAQDAADKIVVDYTPLDAVTDVRAAVKPGAPQLWPEAPGNIGFDWTAPADPDGKKQAALDKAFKEAAHVVQSRAGQSAPGRRLARAAHRHRQLRRSSKTIHLALRLAIGRGRARPGRRPAERQAGRAARRHRGSSAAPSA